MNRLRLWYELRDMGLKTLPEHFSEDTRSDCHGWASHPIYHLYASIIGIRPGSMGFKTVKIIPQLCHLKYAKGKMVHPKGEISFDIKKQKDAIQGNILLPEGISGELFYNGKVVILNPGNNEIQNFA